MYTIVNVILALILMPFVIKKDTFYNRLAFIAACGYFTPIIGIPLYSYVIEKW